MSTTPKKSLRDLGSFEDIIDQRREAIGVKEGTTVKVPGFGKTWEVAVPGLQEDNWNDAWADLHQDLAEGLVSMSAYRTEMAGLVLGDQADDFIAECQKVKQDAAALLNGILEKINEDQSENPTRRNSRNTRGRAKRR